MCCLSNKYYPKYADKRNCAKYNMQLVDIYLQTSSGGLGPLSSLESYLFFLDCFDDILEALFQNMWPCCY